MDFEPIADNWMWHIK